MEATAAQPQFATKEAKRGGWGGRGIRLEGAKLQGRSDGCKIEGMEGGKIEK